MKIILQNGNMRLENQTKTRVYAQKPRPCCSRILPQASNHLCDFMLAKIDKSEKKNWIGKNYVLSDFCYKKWEQCFVDRKKLRLFCKAIAFYKILFINVKISFIFLSIFLKSNFKDVLISDSHQLN